MLQLFALNSTVISMQGSPIGGGGTTPLPPRDGQKKQLTFLRLIEEYIISLDPPRPQPRTHRAAAYRALAHGPQPREPCPMGPQPRELQPR